MINDITTRLENFSLNTVVSGFMEYTNKMIELGNMDRETLRTAAVLIAPFAPHLGEELYSRMGGQDSVFHVAWPKADAEAMKDTEKEIAIQVNGKLRGKITLPVGITKEDAIAAAKDYLGSKLSGSIVKEIYVPGRIVNLVVKG